MRRTGHELAAIEARAATGTGEHCLGPRVAPGGELVAPGGVDRYKTWTP